MVTDGSKVKATHAMHLSIIVFLQAPAEPVNAMSCVNLPAAIYELVLMAATLYSLCTHLYSLLICPLPLSHILLTETQSDRHHYQSDQS